MVPALRRFFASAAAVALLPAWLTAQQPTVISGRVVGENGSPLANATVSVSQLSLGSTTREDGRYTILVPANRVSGQSVTVVARAINFRPQSVTITLGEGAITQDFSLAPNPLQLGELVVTGAGTATEVEKLGSVRDNVSAAQIERSQEASVINALAAKAPNVTVTSSGGDPGASSFIQIRGARTYNGTSQPLFVVDGLPIDYTTYSTQNFDNVEGQGSLTGTATQTRITDLNPSDIESVEILKGPSASSIYGARAAAGAIIITTKAGKAGPTRFSLRSNFSWDTPTKYYPLQTSFARGSFGASSLITDPTTGDQISAGPGLRSWGAPLSTLGLTAHDHARGVFETGLGSDQTLTISGGNDRTLFFLSGNYNSTNGMIYGDNDALRRVTVRLNGSHRLTERLKVGGNVSYANTAGRFVERGNNTSAIMLGDLRTPPEFNNQPDTAANGQHRSYILPNPQPGQERDSRTFDNPFFVIRAFNNRSQTDRVFGNVTAEWAALDWLKFNYSLGADYYNDDRVEGFPVSSSSQPDGAVIAGNITNLQIDHNLTAVATWKQSDNLGGTITIGQNLNHRRNTLRGTVGRIQIQPNLFNLQNTLTRDPMTDQQFKNRIEGYFAQANFDIAQQLFLTGAMRYDGSNTYGANNRRAWYPKASAAWNFVRSRPEGIVTYGKLRASYGEAGIEPSPYGTQTVLRSDLPTIAGGVQGVGLSPTQNGVGGAWLDRNQGNPNLKEERSKEFEAGIDVGLVKDKADLSFTWYNSRTSGVILFTPQATSTGFEFAFTNAGELRNRGIEASLNLRPINKRDFGWDLGFQWARNRNTVLDLKGLDPNAFVELPGSFLVSQGLQVGQPFGVLRGAGLVKCGITPAGDAAIDAACDGAPTGAVYLAANGFPVLDDNVRIIGDPNYDWTGSARTTFRIKGLQVSGLVDVRTGGAIWNGTRGALYSYGTHKDTEQRSTCTGSAASCTGNEHRFGSDFWFNGPVVGPGTELDASGNRVGKLVPIGESWYRVGSGTTFNGNDEDFIEDAGFVRLREVSLQYTLDQPWVRRSLGFSSIDLRIAGRNLLTSTDYRGLDPETNLNQSDGTSGGQRRGLDYFNNPQSRSWVFTVTLNR